MGFGWLVLGTTLASIMMAFLYRRTGSVLVSGIAVHLMNNSAGADLWATCLVMLNPAVASDIAPTRR